MVARVVGGSSLINKPSVAEYIKFRAVLLPEEDYPLPEYTLPQDRDQFGVVP